MAERVCTLCASVGVFRWLRTCREIGHHARTRDDGSARVLLLAALPVIVASVWFVASVLGAAVGGVS